MKTPPMRKTPVEKCIAPVLESILLYYGLPYSASRLRELCGTMETPGIIETAESFGLTVSPLHTSVSSLDLLPLPLILFWDFDRLVIYEGRNEHNYFINDPLAGKVAVSRAGFEERFTGIALSLQPEKFGIAEKFRQKVSSLKRWGIAVVKHWQLVLPLLLIVLSFLIAVNLEKSGFDGSFIIDCSRHRRAAVAECPVIKVAVPYDGSDPDSVKFIRALAAAVELANRQGGRQIEAVNAPFDGRDPGALPEMLTGFCRDMSVAAMYFPVPGDKFDTVSALTVAHSLPLICAGTPENSCYPSPQDLVSSVLESLQRNKVAVIRLIPGNENGSFGAENFIETGKKSFPELTLIPNDAAHVSPVDAIVFAGNNEELETLICQLNAGNSPPPLYIVNSVSGRELEITAGYKGKTLIPDLLFPEIFPEFTAEFTRLYRRKPESEELLAAYGMMFLIGELRKDDYTPEKVMKNFRERSEKFLASVLIRYVDASQRKGK